MLVVIRALRKIRNHPVDVHISDFLSEDIALSGSRINDAKEHLDGRGLPGSVGAEKSEDFALLNVKVEMIDHVDVAMLARLIAFGQLLSFDGGGQGLHTSL